MFRCKFKLRTFLSEFFRFFVTIKGALNGILHDTVFRYRINTEHYMRLSFFIPDGSCIDVKRCFHFFFFSLMIILDVMHSIIPDKYHLPRLKKSTLNPRFFKKLEFYAKKF